MSVAARNWSTLRPCRLQLAWAVMMRWTKVVPASERVPWVMRRHITPARRPCAAVLFVGSTPSTSRNRNTSVPLAQQVRVALREIRDVPASRLAWYSISLASLVAAIVFMLQSTQPGSLLAAGAVGLFLYRYVRNRHLQMLRLFVRKTGKIPEVRMITCKDEQLTVHIDRAGAGLYLRINETITACNRRIFFGKAMTVAIRTDSPQDELNRALNDTGVHYVRPDVVEKP